MQYGCDRTAKGIVHRQLTVVALLIAVPVLYPQVRRNPVLIVVRDASAACDHRLHAGRAPRRQLVALLPGVPSLL
jgi:hypothetical protein